MRAELPPTPGKLAPASELEGGAGVGLRGFLGKCRQSLPSALGGCPPTTASLPLHCSCHSLPTEECGHPDDGPSESSCLAFAGWTDGQIKGWIKNIWVGLWGCRQGVRGLTAPPPAPLEKQSQHPTPLAVPMRDHQAPHFPPESLSSRHSGRCGTSTGPLFQWLKKDSASVGHLPVHGAAPQSPAGAQPEIPRPTQDPTDALRSRRGPHCLSSAICRRRLRQRVLQTHVSLSGSAARASGGTFPWCEVWKVPHGPGEDWARPRERRACVHIFWRSGSLSPQAQV